MNGVFLTIKWGFTAVLGVNSVHTLDPAMNRWGAIHNIYDRLNGLGTIVGQTVHQVGQTGTYYSRVWPPRVL